MRLFALLSTQSVLRHGMAGAEGWDDAAFDDRCRRQPCRSPERHWRKRLFSLRAEGLLHGPDLGPPQPARACRAC